MTRQWIIADRIFDGRTLVRDHAVSVADDAVQSLSAVSDIPDGDVKFRVTGTLVPGFFDIQVNGGGGVLLNNTPSPDSIRTIAGAHRRFGTVAIMPTVITDAPMVLQAAADALIDHGQFAGVMGLHIEGPHLAPARRGTHAAEFLRPLDALTRKTIRRLRDAGWPVLITVAPEIVTPSEIAGLAEMGAVVSLGHSAAGFDLVHRALAAGATGFTHLFNAMPHMQSRDPGIAGAAISSTAWCGLIADGIHVHPAMIALACRSRSIANRMIAVSDAMATVGGNNEFSLYGQTIRLDHNRLVNAQGVLAGAHLTLGQALANLIRFGIAPTDALRMCRQNPAEFLGLEHKMGLVGLASADLVLLDDAFHVTAVGADDILNQPQ